jgi:hypothetical protein
VQNDLEALVAELPEDQRHTLGDDILLYGRADDEARARASELHVEATTELENFRIVPNRGGSHKLEPINATYDATQAAHLAHMAFMASTAKCDELAMDREKRCRQVIHLARVEAMRATFKDAYWTGYLVLADAGRRSFSAKERSAAKKMLQVTRYTDGNGYCRGDASDPLLSIGPYAYSFSSWIEHFSVSESPDFQQRWPGNDILPAVSCEELAAGLALVLMDAASSRPGYAFRAMVNVAILMAYSSGNRAYLEATARHASEASQRASKAVATRHAPGNENRERLIRAYRENVAKYRSKDEAASELSRQYGVAFSTARGYLKGIGT